MFSCFYQIQVRRADPWASRRGLLLIKVLVNHIRLYILCTYGYLRISNYAHHKIGILLTGDCMCSQIVPVQCQWAPLALPLYVRDDGGPDGGGREFDSKRGFYSTITWCAPYVWCHSLYDD